MSLPELSSEGTQIEQPRGVLVRKPKTTIYTVLLGVTLAALVIGCLLLAMEIWQYGALWTSPWSIPSNYKS